MSNHIVLNRKNLNLSIKSTTGLADRLNASLLRLVGRIIFKALIIKIWVASRKVQLVGKSGLANSDLENQEF